LPGVPGCCIEKILNAAPGNEIESGKFDSPESSARLAANALGFFLCRPACLPPLPGCENETWPAVSLDLEARVPFPWRGGLHPVLDVLVKTPCALIGIESKRFEPFRDKPGVSFSDTFCRPVWGDSMEGYRRVMDKLLKNAGLYTHLKADQLVKHALGLWTRTRPGKKYAGMRPILFYIYAEPDCLPNSGKSVCDAAKKRHKKEVEDFANRVKCDEVKFVHCSYREMLACWKRHTDPEIRAHAEAVTRCFSP
jgi:hypothetical protein